MSAVGTSCQAGGRLPCYPGFSPDSHRAPLISLTGQLTSRGRMGQVHVLGSHGWASLRGRAMMMYMSRDCFERPT